jgi:hypothetical protein
MNPGGGMLPKRITWSFLHCSTRSNVEKQFSNIIATNAA